MRTAEIPTLRQRFINVTNKGSVSKHHCLKDSDSIIRPAQVLVVGVPRCMVYRIEEA